MTVEFFSSKVYTGSKGFKNTSCSKLFLATLYANEDVNSFFNVDVRKI